MKNLFPLCVLGSALLAGCAADKSSETQVMAPIGGTPSGTSKASSNPNIPADVKGAMSNVGN